MSSMNEKPADVLVTDLNSKERRISALVKELRDISAEDFDRAANAYSSSEFVTETDFSFSGRNTVDALAQLGFELQTLYATQYEEACWKAKVEHLKKNFEELTRQVNDFVDEGEPFLGVSHDELKKVFAGVTEDDGQIKPFTALASYAMDDNLGTSDAINTNDSRADLQRHFEAWEVFQSKLRLVQGKSSQYAAKMLAIDSAFEECEKAINTLDNKVVIDTNGLESLNHMEAHAEAIMGYAASKITDVSTNYPEKRSLTTRAFAFILLPVLLPLTSFFSGLYHLFAGNGVRGGWYSPLALLNRLGFRQSAAAAFDQAIGRLQASDGALDTDLLRLMNTRFDELVEDIVQNRISSRGDVIRHLKAYKDAANNYMDSVNDNKSKGDFRSAAKARRSFVKILIDEDKVSLNGLLKGGSKNNISINKAENSIDQARRGSDIIHAIAATVYADRTALDTIDEEYTDNRHLKRKRLQVATATGVATHKEVRGAIKTALQFLKGQELWVPSSLDETTAKHKASILSKAAQQIIGESESITATQKFILVASKLLAFSYALGCGFGIAAGLVALPFFATGALALPLVGSLTAGAALAVGLGLAFTAVYNWMLAKYCLPKIVLNMLPKKIKAIEEISQASLLKKPFVFVKQVLLGVAWVVQRLVGLALLPVLSFVAGIILLPMGKISTIISTQKMNNIAQNQSSNSFYSDGAVESQVGDSMTTSRLKRFKARLGLFAWKLYHNTLVFFGLLSPRIAANQGRVAFYDAYDFRGDHVAWFMLLVSGSGFGLLFLTSLPVIVPILIIVTGVGALFYSVSSKFSGFTNEKNEKKTLSSSRRALLSATVSLVALMSVATAALAVPGLEIVKGFAVEMGAAFVYSAFAAFVIVGTIAAMFAIGLVGFVEMFQVPSLSLAIASFIDSRITKQKIVQGETKKEKGALVEQAQDGWKGRLAVFLRGGSYAAFITFGASATGALCVTMADAIANSMPMFASAKIVMVLAMFASMLGLMVQVWTALWKAVVWTISNPVDAMKSFKSSLSSVIDWAFNWGQDNLDGHWYEGAAGLTAATYAVVGLFVLAPVKLALVVVLTHLKQLLIDFPVAVFKSVVGLLPSVQANFALSPASVMPADLSEAQHNRKSRALNTVRTWYVNFTRIGNAVGNALLNYSTVKEMTGSQSVTIFTLIVGWMQSFAALYLTQANKSDEDILSGNFMEMMQSEGVVNSGADVDASAGAGQSPLVQDSSGDESFVFGM